VKSNKDQRNDINAIEQIRDIVFGREMASYEERFSKTERELADQIEQLRQDLSEVKSVAQDRLEHERDSLSEQIANLGEALEGLQKSFLSFQRDTESRLVGLGAASLSRKDFSEALLEMSFRFTEDGEGAQPRDASKAKKLPN